jgi:NADH-quinone oxidoreductase subunit H
MGSILLIALIKIAILVGGLMTAAAYFVLLERKMAAWCQDRVGPDRVGLPLSLFGLKDLKLWGFGQPAADGLKIILKEEFTPAHVDKRLFILAPVLILSAALAVFAVIPFGSLIPPFELGPLKTNEPIDLTVAPGVDVGMIYVFALSSIAVYGVILGGWASNNKYSFLGMLRSSAQLIAYELPMAAAILGVVLSAGSLDLGVIINAQAGGYWYALVQPLGFIVFVIAAFAEAARLPFDLPECEQELIGGYHTEYSGIKLLLFLVGEYMHMITAAFLIAILYLGGWHLPFITGPVGPDATITWPYAILRIIVLSTKVVALVAFFMLVRWSWPRFRFDQLMNLAWKVMLPLGLVNLVFLAVLYELLRINGWFLPEVNIESSVGRMPTTEGWLLLIVGGWIALAVAWVMVSLSKTIISDNRPRLDTNPTGIDVQI